MDQTPNPIVIQPLLQPGEESQQVGVPATATTQSTNNALQGMFVNASGNNVQKVSAVMTQPTNVTVTQGASSAKPAGTSARLLPRALVRNDCARGWGRFTEVSPLPFRIDSDPARCGDTERTERDHGSSEWRRSSRGGRTRCSRRRSERAGPSARHRPVCAPAWQSESLSKFRSVNMKGPTVL